MRVAVITIVMTVAMVVMLMLTFRMRVSMRMPITAAMHVIRFEKADAPGDENAD